MSPRRCAFCTASRPLVILAEKVDGGALGMLVANNRHRTIEAVAARALGFGHRRIQHLGGDPGRDLRGHRARGTALLRAVPTLDSLALGYSDLAEGMARPSSQI